MIDLPPAIESSVKAFDLGSITAALQEAGPFLSIAKETWSRETLLDILSGHIAVPDEEINKAIAENIAKRKKEDPNVRSLTVTSRQDGQLQINADTRSLGKIEMSGIIEECVHDGTSCWVTYRMKERSLGDQGLLSWIVSRISLSMTSKLFGGDLEFADDIPVTLKGNRLKVDFTERVQKSRLAAVQYNGCSLLSMLRVESAVPHEGYIVFDTGMVLPDKLKEALKNIFRF